MTENSTELDKLVSIVTQEVEYNQMSTVMNDDHIRNNYFLNKAFKTGKWTEQKLISLHNLRRAKISNTNYNNTIRLDEKVSGDMCFTR